MGQVRIADLPTLDRIDASSYIIVEKPGYETGTFKMKLVDIQDVLDLGSSNGRSAQPASTSTAEIEQLRNLVASLSERVAVLEANQSTNER